MTMLSTIPVDVKDLVAVAMTKKLDTEPLPAGEYTIQGVALVKVDVTIKKAPATTYRPTCHLPLKAVLAVALRKAGVQAGNIAAVIAEAAQEALALGEKVGEELEATEAAIKQVEAMLDKLPPQKREGATRVEGSVQVVGMVDADSDVRQVA